MKLLNFAVIKLTICLICGIIIGFYFSIPIKTILISLSLFTLSLIVSYFYCETYKKSSLLFTGFAFAVFILVGILSTSIYDETNRSLHYVNSTIEYTNYQDFSFRIKKRLKSDNYNHKYIAEIESLNAKKAIGQILINLDKDSLQNELTVDNLYFTNTKLSEVVKPKNPFQFDYHNYLKQRNVNHQIYIKQDELILLKSDSKSIAGYAHAFRKSVNFKLKKNGFKPEALAIINALLLGQRQDISPEIYNNYVNAGTIHILAVSGLHVGIIFLILTQILKPLHRIKHGKHVIKPILIVLLLWCFAFIAGLSPSVTRAVTMFSIIAISQHLRRPTNIYNTLTISAFLMLLFKPIYLFDVGFQMSYLAVLAIVSIQPILYNLWKAPNLVLNKFWEIFTVTVAAQIGVAPIGLFYFHQFPGLFFVSNLVIIPVLGLILGLGILVIALALLNILPSVLVTVFSFIINTLNAFIAWVAQFEDFLLRDISFSIYHVFSSYLIIITGLYLWKRRTLKSLHYSLMSLLLFSCVLLHTKYKNTCEEFIIFNKNRTTVLAKKTNQSLMLYHDLDSLTTKEDKTIKNYQVGSFINTTFNDSLKTVYTYKNNIILIIDSLGIYNVNGFKPNLILLRNSPKINLDRLIDSLKPEQIIADASNYKSYVNRWKQTCMHKKIPFHSTYEKGVFILK
ncbi:ComEC/Rec2 family competence protein [Winogradskyella haliclonae]|uniref:Competence protein ComEC n=1 Tax=Winogradskyella haliclonae TaxID=2048558 RepID=A0ABQ2BXU4_9FLAO|nr:ComEC/Rec2 family competence protein [Winogradskyella haliclonae]GGI56690.1 competence protein ComEC [Winogradskyella haliclonae]